MARATLHNVQIQTSLSGVASQRAWREKFFQVWDEPFELALYYRVGKHIPEVHRSHGYLTTVDKLRHPYPCNPCYPWFMKLLRRLGSLGSDDV